MIERRCGSFVLESGDWGGVCSDGFQLQLFILWFDLKSTDGNLRRTRDYLESHVAEKTYELTSRCVLLTLAHIQNLVGLTH